MTELYFRNREVSSEIIDGENKKEAKEIYREFKKWRKETYDLPAPNFREVMNGDCIPDDGERTNFKFTIVRTSDGRPVGLLIINEKWPEKDILFIGMMYLSKDMRGKGIGKSILNSLYDFAGSGYKRLRVRVHKTNEIKPIFFLKNGFKTVHFLMGNDHILERSIN